MKEYRRKEEEGVSPVIATILMVAITVVLAATLYLMVGNMGGSQNTPVAGSLSYVSAVSDPHPTQAKNRSIIASNATFEVVLNTPSNPKIGDISISILTSAGARAPTNVTYGIIHITSDSNHLKSGDRIYITNSDGMDLHGYQVLISIAGYAGTITGTVPS